MLIPDNTLIQDSRVRYPSFKNQPKELSFFLDRSLHTYLRCFNSDYSRVLNISVVWNKHVGRKISLNQINMLVGINMLDGNFLRFQLEFLIN